MIFTELKVAAAQGLGNNFVLGILMVPCFNYFVRVDIGGQ
jgi:hypothetical protein